MQKMETANDKPRKETRQKRKPGALWALLSLVRRLAIGRGPYGTAPVRLNCVTAAIPSPQHTRTVPEIHTSDDTMNRVHSDDGENESRARHGRCSRWSGGWQSVMDRTGWLLPA